MFLAIPLLAVTWIPANLDAQAPTPQQVQPTQPPPSTKGKTAAQFYKNIKVLKDIPAESIYPAMEYITVALGVGCDYCHDVKNFDKDDKLQKQNARNMMKMEFALNGAVFEGQTRVTCYTCHRGVSRGAAYQVFSAEKGRGGKPPAGTFAPVAVPNVVLDSSLALVQPAPGTPPVAGAAVANAAPAVALPSFDEVFAKYNQALGSTDAIEKLSTVVERGTVEMLMPSTSLPPGAPTAPPKMGRVDAEIYRKIPDKALLLIHLPTTLSKEGYDGSTAWLGTSAFREETGGERGVVQEWAEFFPAIRFKDTHSRLNVDSIEKIGDRDAYRVSGFREDGAGYDRFYVDTQTGLLLRTVTYMNSVLGSYPVETNFEDYRDVSGVKFPFTIHEVTPQGDRTYRWDQIEFNGRVEDTAFNKPPQPPPPAPR
jgi:hypothetical protein